MLNRYWGPILAIGGAVAVSVLAFAIATLNRPSLDPDVFAAPAVLSECGYQEASEAAAKAQAREQEARDSGSRRLLRERAEEARAAKAAKEDAQKCEERARANADLLAQRSAAVSAANAARLAERQLWWTTAEFSVLLATAILAVVALLDTRGASRRQLRAYVFAENVDLIDGATLEPPLPDFVNIPAVTLQIRNSGATPAHNVVHWAGIDVLGIQNERQIQHPDISDMHSGTWMPSGGTMTKSVTLSVRLSTEQVEAVREGNMAIYVYGVIRYRDIFGRLHHTRYVLRHTRSYPPRAGGRMYFAEEGNSAD